MADEYILKSSILNYLRYHSAFKSKSEIMQDIAEHEPADVVQVVFCKDCEWATKSTELPGWYMCKCEEAFDYYAKPDDFCSHGERREE